VQFVEQFAFKIGVRRIALPITRGRVLGG
jgi:hypothetical protein